MTVTETPAATVRAAAALMRTRAQAATPGRRRVIAIRDPGWLDYPSRVLTAWTTERGGEATTGVADCRPHDAEHIAGADPAVMTLIADQWDAIAADMDVLHAVERPEGAADWSGQTHAAWTKTLTAARAYLTTDQTGAK